MLKLAGSSDPTEEVMVSIMAVWLRTVRAPTGESWRGGAAGTAELRGPTDTQ